MSRETWKEPSEIQHLKDHWTLNPEFLFVHPELYILKLPPTLNLNLLYPGYGALAGNGQQNLETSKS